MTQVVVIGAGIGGLATAAVLARQGLEVNVLEAHVLPGGCASTFYYQGYRFDAGATLAAGFYPNGPMDLLAQAAGITDWGEQPASLAMQVHFPSGESIPVTGGEDRWNYRQRMFGEEAIPFFEWQERAANALWELALQRPPWPPQSSSEMARLLVSGAGWAASGKHWSLIADAFRSVAAHFPKSNKPLRRFIDAQLLISAQTTSEKANALYGASALDLARRGVVHLSGGMGSIAERLVQAIRAQGGKVRFRQEVSQILVQSGKPTLVVTGRGEKFPADLVVANLTDWDLLRLVTPEKMQRSARSQEGWGAFMAYLGINEAVLPSQFPLHHQVILADPPGEGNTVFLSISPPEDALRAPAGKRAITLSTHTHLADWWELHTSDPQGYEDRKRVYLDRLIAGAEKILPGLSNAVQLALPGTPITFQRYTRRAQGWVGGFPQTGLLRFRGPRWHESIWQVGDSIFPGQSVAAVALGSLRTAEAILQAHRLNVQGWNISKRGKEKKAA